MSSTQSSPVAQRVRGLRVNSLAAAVILLLEYGLGIWVNLYGHLPASDHGGNIATGFARAIANGPVGLSIHAVLAVLLIVSAVTAVVRSILVRRPVLIAATGIGLLAIVESAVAGALFVGSGNNASSLAMAISAGVALAAYALVLFISGSPQAAVRA